MAHATTPGRVPMASHAHAKRNGAERRPPAEAIDFGPLADWVGFYLRLAQSASFQAFARATEEVDLRPGRFSVLLLIGRNPGISQTALSRANGRDKSTLTPALNDLERRGLIVRTRVASDRRSYQLSLTRSGEAMLRRLTACAERHDHNLDRIIGKRDRARFLQILRKLVAELG
ncbi:MAG: MarR family transcriptional regulator [Hyphomonadaceae bacterium]|jgi:DNA-binding MarR family transcriptional regulator|nr:MarR family transcriptional regulator [Hyphomonadaceae bacterium]